MGVLGGCSIWQQRINCARPRHDVGIDKVRESRVCFGSGGTRGISGVVTRARRVTRCRPTGSLVRGVTQTNNRD